MGLHPGAAAHQELPICQALAFPPQLAPSRGHLLREAWLGRPLSALYPPDYPITCLPFFSVPVIF